MILSFIGCMLCLCIMAGSVGGVLLSMYIVQVTADDAETLDLDNQKNKQTSIIYDRYSDEYDQLTRELKTIEAQFPQLVTPDSHTGAAADQKPDRR